LPRLAWDLSPRLCCRAAANREFIGGSGSPCRELAQPRCGFPPLRPKGAPSSISVPRAALPGRALPDTALALSIALNERQSMAFPLGLRFKAIIARFSAKQTKFSTAGTRSMSLPATRLTTRVELFYCRGPTSGRMRPRPRGLSLVIIAVEIRRSKPQAVREMRFHACRGRNTARRLSASARRAVMFITCA
jgi:hypothetical protein